MLFAEFGADQAASSVDGVRAARPWWSESEIAIEAEAAGQRDVPATSTSSWRRACEAAEPAAARRPVGQGPDQ
ncbi:hypothetical protein [Actinospica robiniae]|uniref:hypothetical protein n=1 Tax=Actinospica robiniae TaxID=304901 RepID=UPI0003FBE609|nr:hypothetical protein [Actinospica robiniae]